MKPPAALPRARARTGIQPGRSGSSVRKALLPRKERSATTQNRHNKGSASCLGRDRDRGALWDAWASGSIGIPTRRMAKPAIIRSGSQENRMKTDAYTVPTYRPRAPGDTNTPRGAAFTLPFRTSSPPPTWNMPLPIPQTTAASRGTFVKRKLTPIKRQPAAAKGRFRSSLSARRPNGSCKAKAQAL